MPQLLEINSAAELIVDFNTGVHRKNKFSINECFHSLGEDVCLALAFFHCFTGPDSTYSFHNHTKDWYSGWKHWLMNDDLTKAFQYQSWRPTEQVSVNTESVIVEFVSYVYFKKVVDVDELRFASCSRVGMGAPSRSPLHTMNK